MGKVSPGFQHAFDGQQFLADAKIPEDAKEAIAHGNAEKFLGL